MIHEKKRTLESDEQHLYRVLSSDRFVNMEGLSKEIPFFIYDYDPRQANAVAAIRDRVTTKLEADNGLSVTQIDVYDLVIKLLKDRGVWERVLKLELDVDKQDFRDALQPMLDPKDHLAPAIQNMLAETPSDMVFLTGLGEVWPYIRTHTVLENLQSVVTDRPLLAWFPGTYDFTQATGHQLRALNLTTSDSYYRAKEIIKQEA